MDESIHERDAVEPVHGAARRCMSNPVLEEPSGGLESSGPHLGIPCYPQQICRGWRVYAELCGRTEEAAQRAQIFRLPVVIKPRHEDDEAIGVPGNNLRQLEAPQL